MISWSSNSLGNTYTQHTCPVDFSPVVSSIRSSVLSIRFEKQSAPRVIHAEPVDHPERVSQISWYIHERSRSVTCAAREPGHCCARDASVRSALCARNNHCIIRFQSGLEVICIDLLSSHHRLFGDCGHIDTCFAPSAIREPRVILVLRITWLTYQSQDHTRPVGGNVKRSRSQLSRYYLFKRRCRFDFCHSR